MYTFVSPVQIHFPEKGYLSYGEFRAEFKKAVKEDSADLIYADWVEEVKLYHQL